ncbi:MAG: hypothetical protein N2C12_18660, partial [Planctomycetales bacterium]
MSPQTVSLPIWQPPHLQVQDVRRIAVLEMDGEQQTESFRRNISDQLAESGYFEIVWLPPLAASMAAENVTSPRIIYQRVLQARSLGIDTLITGTVRSGYGGTRFGNVAVGDTEMKVVANLKVINVR